MSDNWRTPDSLYDALNERWGFVLDAAANHDNTKCKLFFTNEPDGLAMDWLKTSGGKPIWCNPPFSMLDEFAFKAAQESMRGCTIVMIMPANRTEQKWFHDHVLGHAKIEYLRGRTKFELPPDELEAWRRKKPGRERKKPSAPQFGCLLAVYLPPNWLEAMW